MNPAIHFQEFDHERSERHSRLARLYEQEGRLEDAERHRRLSRLAAWPGPEAAPDAGADAR